MDFFIHQSINGTIFFCPLLFFNIIAYNIALKVVDGDTDEEIKTKKTETGDSKESFSKVFRGLRKKLRA